MTFYANKRMYSYIRKAVIGIMIASVGVSALRVPMATADAKHVKEPVTVTKEARPTTLKTVYMDSTAYTSTPEECDSDPFTTADGSDVRDGIVATNVLPFGTKVRLPTVFGDRIFEVHDRMNARYSYRVDIWMNDYNTMIKYGLKRNIPIEVVEYGTNKTQWAARAEKMKIAREAKKIAKEVAVK